MNLLFNEYSNILFFFIISSLLSLIIFFFSYLLTPQRPDQEKVSAYECGFNPFDDARATFDIRFYLVAILFLIFDLEISFLFP
jgi:NADH:ubiquinone oxidoreductase subunit 3 (subunit A)